MFIGNYIKLDYWTILEILDHCASHLESQWMSAFFATAPTATTGAILLSLCRKLVQCSAHRILSVTVAKPTWTSNYFHLKYKFKVSFRGPFLDHLTTFTPLINCLHYLHRLPCPDLPSPLFPYPTLAQANPTPLSPTQTPIPLWK